MSTDRNDKGYVRYRKLAERHLSELTEGRSGRRRKRDNDFADEQDFVSDDEDEDVMRKLRKVEEDVKVDGENLEPFNLNEEREEGVVSRDGVLIQDVKARINDSWLDSIEGVDPYKPPSKESSGDEAEVDMIGLKALVKKLLKPKESTAKALRRLRGPIIIPTKKSRGEAPPKFDLTDFNKLNEACSTLLGHGFADVYEWTSEDLN